MPEDKVYTRREVLKAIEDAFFDGVDAGQVEYGGDNFNAVDYLPEPVS